VLPWEAPGAGVKEFFLTMYGIMARPSWALAAPLAGPWPRWAGFALIMWFLVFLARYLLSWAWSAGAMGGLEMLAWGIMGMVVQAAIFLPLYSGAVYLTLKLLTQGQNPPPFAPVLRAVCYSQVSTAAMLLPMVGIIAHIVWNVALLSIALRASLGLTRRTALLGVILPMIAFFLLGLALASLGMAV
jgi:hypothetical protein